MKSTHLDTKKFSSWFQTEKVKTWQSLKNVHVGKLGANTYINQVPQLPMGIHICMNRLNLVVTEITAISVFLDKVSGTLRKWQQNLCSLDTHTTIISITSSSHSVIHTSTPSSIITPSSSYWSIIWSWSLAQQSSWWIIKSFDFTPATSEDLNIPIWKWFKVQVSA